MPDIPQGSEPQAQDAPPTSPPEADTQSFRPDGSAGTSPPSERCQVPPGLVRHLRYEVLDLLGAGGMGCVYLARHRFMDRLVALKVINRNLLDRPAMVARFLQEVRAAARLAHPNIVRAYDADQAGDAHFLVMEYVPGVDLDRVA